MDRQAVSYWRALHSGVWSAPVDESGPQETAETPYSYSGIDRCRRLIETGELCWERLIRAREADALVVTNEDLTTAFAATVQRVASYISPGLHVIVPAPTTRRLSDEGSDELLGRPQAERAERVTTRSH